MTDKKILFTIFLIIGIVAIVISFYYYSETSKIAEYVALFTSVSTAVYTILSKTKERTEPILRITPLLSDPNMSFWGLDIWIENIGYSIAKDIEVKCQLVPDASIPLENNGIFKHSLLAPKEITKCSVIIRADNSKPLSRQLFIAEVTQQKLIIEVSYSNEDDKKQKPIKKKVAIAELEHGFGEVKTTH